MSKTEAYCKNDLTCSVLRTMFAFFLSQRFIGDITHSLLTGDEEDAAMTRFQAALHEISASIKARNASLELPYINLLPERIPNSIGV